MNYGKKTARLWKHGAAALGMLVSLSGGALFAQEAQQSPSPIVQEAQKKGISAGQLKSLGIDPNNPAQAAERARQLGASPGDIQRALDAANAPQSDAGAGAPSSPEAGAENKTPGDVPDPGTPAEPVPAEEIPPEQATEDAAQHTADSAGALYGTGRFSGLRYYGYDIFRMGKGSVGPIEVGPVDPDYPIGAGDALRVTLWGEVEFQNELTVSRDGNIVIPKAGQIFVAGTRLSNLRDTMKNYLSKFYSGLAQDPPTIFIDVTLARLRSNQVYIMGEVERPGAYAISSYATAFNAMYAIGGPKISGSLREVRILREGSLVTRVDLYDYLIKGSSPHDHRLQMGDIVFVPPRALTVAIKGEVLRPGIYELTSSENLTDLVKLSGGLNPSAYAFRAQIDRIRPLGSRVKGQAERELIDVDIEAVMSGRRPVPLVNGDHVSIFPIIDNVENYVDIIGGGVLRPGRYELSERIRTISDIIRAADGLTGDAYTLRADLVRTREDLTKEFIEIDLEAALRGESPGNIEIMRWDVIRVYSKLELIGAPQVTLGGFVRSPGTFPLHDNMTVYDLLFSHAGLQDSLRTARTFMDRADIFRLNRDGKTRHVVSFNLGDVWSRKPGGDLLLQREDQVMIYSNDVREYFKRVVKVSGAVKNPGTFAWENNMTLADALLKAGGFAEGAWIYEAEIARIPHSGIPGDSLAYSVRAPILDAAGVPGNPEDAIHEVFANHSPARETLLEPNDHIFIRTNPDYNSIQTVVISGEVEHPGEYAITKQNERLSELIARAGGLKSNAYAGGGQLIRQDHALFVDFEDLILNKNKKHDVIALPGDRIIIPPRPNTVMVTGEVINPGFYKFQPGMKASGYLKLSGGRTENGGKAYVTHPSGYTDRMGFFRNPKVKEGTVLRVLPKKPEVEKEDTDWPEFFKETTAILSSALMVIYLSKQIQ